MEVKMKEWFKLFYGYMLSGLLASLFAGIYYVVNIHTMSVQCIFVLLWFISVIIVWHKLDIKV